MAYINQYQADQQNQAREQDTLNKIGAGLEKYFTLDNENRRRALDAKKEAEKNARDQARYEQEKAQKDSLYDSDIAEKRYKEVQRGLPLEERDDFKQQTAIAKLRGDSAANLADVRGRVIEKRMNEAENKKIEAEQRAIQNEKLKGVQKAKISGFDIANPDEVIPTTKDAEEVKKFNSANKTFQEVGQRAADRVSKLDWKDRTGFTNNYKNLQQDITEMRLQAKELANLGVLNGPDLKLVDETLGSVGVSDLNLYGPEEASVRIKRAIVTANQKLMNAVNARGYKAKTQEVAPPDLTVGAIDGGYMFKRGDPSDQTNWEKVK